MRNLSIRDLRALNESVLALNSVQVERSFAERLSTALASLIAFDHAAVECFDSSGAWLHRLLGDPGGMIERHFPAFLRLSRTHPLFPPFLAGEMDRQALRISDFASRARLHNLELFHDFLKPIGVDAQLGVSLSLMDGSHDVLILSRKGADFTRSDTQRLTAFLPHIAQARQHAAQVAASYIPGRGKIAETNKSIVAAILQREFGLTCRESEVLWWLTRGKCDKEVASLCDISRRTVQKHCESIYRKCGVEGRTMAVILALERSRQA